MPDICRMNVVITSATAKETELIKQKLAVIHGVINAKLSVTYHVSGVGILASCYLIARLISEQKPGLIIQAGIAGTFNHDTALGNVVAVKSEFLADTGVEESGSFQDVFDLNLQAANAFPFTNKALNNPWLDQINYLQLPEVTGVTINEITTRAERIRQIKEKYNPAIESMEGSSLHYCCLQGSVPFIQIRAVSNYVGERDKAQWKFKESFENLSNVVVKYLEHLNSLQ